MKKYIFPYGFRLSLEGGKMATFPAINLGLVNENLDEEFSFLVLIDSGAEISLFTRSDGELLGLTAGQGERVEIGSASGDKFVAFLHTVILRIGDQEIKAQVAFSEKDDSPRVLGRREVFDKFFIVFDEAKTRSIFFPRKDTSFDRFIQ